MLFPFCFQIPPESWTRKENPLIATSAAQPNRYSVCFFPFPPFFFDAAPPPSPSPSPSTSPPSAIGAEVEATLLPHGLGDAVRLLLPSSHRTVPRVSPDIKVFGLAAVGSAGNAPALTAAAVGGGRDVGREDVGDGRAEELLAEGAVQGVFPTRPAPTRLADAADMAGTGVAELMELPQLPFRLTAD